MSSFFSNACPSRLRVRVPLTGARVLVLLLLVAPAAGAAAPSPLSLEEAVRMAVEAAPMLDARRAQREAALQESRRAGALPDPTLTVGIDNLPVTGPDAFDPGADPMTMRRIGIRQEIPAAAERDARRDLAIRVVNERQAQTRAAHLEIRRRSAEAWVALWAAQRELTEVAALREQAELASDLARARVSGGSELAADALAFEAAVLELDNRIAAAQAQVEAAQAELARWIGLPTVAVGADMPDFSVLPVPKGRLLSETDGSVRCWRPTLKSKLRPRLLMWPRRKSARTGAWPPPTASAAMAVRTWLCWSSASSCRCLPPTARTLASLHAAPSTRRRWPLARMHAANKSLASAPTLLSGKP